MHNLCNVRVAGQQIQLIKLIGAFVMFAAVLMFFFAAAQMFENWGSIKVVNNCLMIAKGDEAFFNSCRTMAEDAFNVFVKPDQAALNGKQIYLILIEPVANLFIWIAILLFGVLLYNTPNKVMIPVTDKTEKKWKAKK